MMREIRYRGLTEEGRWIYGLPNHDEDDGTWFIAPSFDEGGKQVIPETVGEYTGLKDKNGKELDWWEGDLISSASSRVIYEIFWNKDYGQWYGRRVNFISDHSPWPLCECIGRGLEKIGDIHATPKLLEADPDNCLTQQIRKLEKRANK